jgi:hypothetical protein
MISLQRTSLAKSFVNYPTELEGSFLMAFANANLQHDSRLTASIDGRRASLKPLLYGRMFCFFSKVSTL